MTMIVLHLVVHMTSAINICVTYERAGGVILVVGFRKLQTWLVSCFLGDFISCSWLAKLVLLYCYDQTWDKRQSLYLKLRKLLSYGHTCTFVRFALQMMSLTGPQNKNNTTDLLPPTRETCQMESLQIRARFRILTTNTRLRRHKWLLPTGITQMQMKNPIVFLLREPRCC